MAIDGCGVDEPFYISSAGSNDEGRIQHDGTDLLIDNDTGKTKIGDKTNHHLTIDHSNGRIGILTASPNYNIHLLEDSSTTATVVAERDTKAKAFVSATDSYGQFGTINSYTVRIFVNASSKMTIDASGNASIPAAYTTVIGGTNTDLHIDNTGLLGPNPSSIRFKENIRELEENDTNWLYQVPIKKYDMKVERGGEKDKIGIIAEEIEMVNKKTVRYGVHEVTEKGPVLLNSSQYDLSEANALLPGIEQEDIPVYRKALNKNQEDIKIKECKKLILLPISVNLTDFIIPMLKEIQELRKEINILKNG